MERRRRFHHAATICVFILGLAATTGAVDFAGGTGTWDDPYRIATAEQLISIGSDRELLESHYVLIADIDLDPNLSQDYAFADGPIDRGFAGVFDGGGHRIRHLTIVDTTEKDYADCGLFRSIRFGGEVKRLILEDVRIISSSRHADVGAICADNDGIVSQCLASGILSANSRSGGVVGWNTGVVEQCASICTVSGSTAGGLIGYHTGRVRDCYTSGHVSGAVVGGLAGESWSGPIRRCYAACQVEGTGSYSGGLTWGDKRFMSEVENSYFLDPSEGGGPDNGYGTPLSSEQMEESSNFEGWDFWGMEEDGRRALWYMPDDGFPRLVWQALEPGFRSTGLPNEQACEFIEADGVRVGAVIYDYDHAIPAGHMVTARPHPGVSPGTAVDVVSSLGPYDWATDAGTGVAESPYLIASAGQLDCLAYEPSLWGRHFTLISDLDLAGRVYGRPLLGHLKWGGATFDGSFDGNGHPIRNLTVEGCAVREIGLPILGLFGEIGPSASVRDLGVTEVFARGGRGGIGGMLCAVNRGRIERCFSAGVLQGYGEMGGLAGRNAGTIEDCYARGRIGVILSLDAPYAGLVGWNEAGTIRTCYAACSVPSAWGNGLVGGDWEGSIELCLWDIETSGTHASAGGMGLTTDELMSVQVLQQYGWGGNPNWIVDDGNDYPRLTWEGTQGTLIPEPQTRP